MTRLKRVLVISPHFPPTNAPDAQRIRMALPYLKANGWQADVLCVHADHVSMAQDPWLSATLPKDVAVYAVTEESIGARLLKINSLWFRFSKAIWRKGTELLSSNPYDLIFFSTTQFPFMSLGPKWKRLFGVPYVVDYQDPWLNDFYFKSNTRPPGGWVRYYPQYINAHRLEGQVIRDVGGVIAVSDHYLLALKKYTSSALMKVLPFGAPINDLNHLPSSTFEEVANQSGVKRWVYLGRGGEDLLAALRPFFLLLAEFLRYRGADDLRLEFVGTQYYSSKKNEKPIEDLAMKCGLKEFVTEYLDRIPYGEALLRMQRADVVLLVGSNDRAYSPSKIFPAMMCGRPLLAVGDSSSKVHAFMTQFNAGKSLMTDDQKSAAVSLEWAIEQSRTTPYSGLNRQAFSRVTASAMTRRLCWVFDHVVEAKK